MTSFFSSPATVARTESRSDHPAPQAVACQLGQDDLCRTEVTQPERIAAAYRDMTEALIEYHVHGDFLAAASYTTAHNKWKQAVLDSIKGDAE